MTSWIIFTLGLLVGGIVGALFAILWAMHQYNL